MYVNKYNIIINEYFTLSFLCRNWKFHDICYLAEFPIFGDSYIDGVSTIYIYLESIFSKKNFVSYFPLFDICDSVLSLYRKINYDKPELWTK